jgi:cytochrome c oxidase assembly protein subunit 15
LGCATWVVKYGWPEFFASYAFAAPYTIQAKSLFQALIVTSHVATGSLILATSVALFARSVRLVRVPVVALGSSALMLELAT